MHFSYVFVAAAALVSPSLACLGGGGLLGGLGGGCGPAPCAPPPPPPVAAPCGGPIGGCAPPPPPVYAAPPVGHGAYPPAYPVAPAPAPLPVPPPQGQFLPVSGGNAYVQPGNATYAIVVYASLVNKNVLPADPGPDFIPFTNVPIRYNVSLKFDTSHNRTVQDYSGEGSLLFVVRDTSNRIFIHAGPAIKIGRCSLKPEEGGGEIAVLKGVYNPKTEIQTLIPSSNLTVDREYRLNFDFEVKIDSENGAKTFNYISQAGEKRNGLWFSTPRAAPKGLRYLFPCLDASQFPALFDLTVSHRITLRCLSNFKGKSKLRPPYLVDHFQASARLYSTQVGLVLCDFPFQRQEINGTQVTTYYNPAALTDINTRRLQQFMDKTSISIGKLDVVVVPSAPTVHLPGLSILNERETVAENNAING